jgi:hypothetical protein
MLAAAPFFPELACHLDRETYLDNLIIGNFTTLPEDKRREGLFAGNAFESNVVKHFTGRGVLGSLAIICVKILLFTVDETL